jgi:protein HIRA/HIR1
LHRSWDGLTLYAVSSDGTLAVFNFDPEELEGICEHGVQGTYLKKFGFKPPPIPEGFSHHEIARQLTPPPSPKSQPHSQQSMDQTQTGFGNGSTVGGVERVNVLVAKRGGKKRAGLTNVIPPSQPFSSSNNVSSGPSTNNAFSVPTLNGVAISKRAQLNQSLPERASSIFDVDSDNWGSTMDVKIDAVEEGGRKRKASSASMMDGDEPKRARTLGGERKRTVLPAREIATASGSSVRAPWNGGSGAAPIDLPVPALMTRITTTIQGSDDLFEAINPEGEGMPLH